MTDTTKTPVILLFGGPSAEHEISLLSARNVFLALDRTRHEPILVGIDRDGIWHREREATLQAATGDPRQVKLDPDAPAMVVPTNARDARAVFGENAIAFPIVHGTFGEDGRLQALLETMGLPYVGSGVLGSAMGMDKDIAKQLLTQADVPVVPWQTVRAAAYEREPDAVLDRVAALEFPVFVKPARTGSSVGVRKAANREQLQAALAHALSFDDKALVEAAVNAREVECAVLGNDAPQASGLGEIVVTHKDGFYSYDAKYVDPDGARTQMPADLPAEVSQMIRDLAIRAFQVLELSGLARVDFFVERGTLEVFLNEVNTLPGFTAISMYPKLWEAAGLSQARLVQKLLDLALERHRRRQDLRIA